MPTSHFQPGDVDLKKIWLISRKDNSCIDIRGQVLEFSVYEDISKPFMYCELVIDDAIGILEGMPLIGEEVVQIEFETPGVPETQQRSIILWVYTIQNLEQTDKLKSTIYILKACSPTLLTNSSTYISKGYKDTIGNIVQDIVKNYCQYTRQYFIESTKGIQELVIPKMRPYQAIDFLRKQSVSSKNRSNSYVFFENQNGLYFTTLEELIQNNKIGSRSFVYTPIAYSVGAEGAGYRSILEYYNSARVNTLNKTRDHGAYSSSFTFDLLTKKILTNYQSFGGQQNVNMGSNPTSTPEYYRNIGAMQNPQLPDHFITSDASKPNNFSGEHISMRDLYVGNIQQYTNILVHGDASIKAGETVNLSLFNIQNSKEAPSLVSGKHLITKVRHRIMLGSRTIHQTSMQLVKDMFS